MVSLIDEKEIGKRGEEGEEEDEEEEEEGGSHFQT